MSNCFILLAAGKGKRFKSNTLKQFTNYKNKPLFMHSIEKAIKSNLFKSVFFVIFIFSSSPLINFIFLLLFKNKVASSVTSFLLFFDN